MPVPSTHLRRVTLLHLAVLAGALAPRAANAQATPPPAPLPPPASPTPPTLPTSAARAELDAMLDDITRAVRAADKAAYLSHVDLSDPEFAIEQQHWVDDLGKHKPLEFSLAILDDPDAPPPPVITDSRAEVTLRMSYRMEIGHAAVPGGKNASWPALFIKEDPDGDGPRPAQWLYKGERWQSITGVLDDGAAFEVLYFPPSRGIADEVRKAFPPAKAHADEGFEITSKHHIQIKLFDSMEHLKATVYLSMPDEVLGGWNEPGESIKFMSSYTKGVEHWTSAFAHEYGHVATWELGPKPKNLPWWVAEGVAELCAEYFTHDRDRIDRMIRQMAQSPGFGKPGGLVEWDDIADYDKARAEVKHLAYFQGHHMVGYISERWGRKGRNAWLRALTSGKMLDEATRDTLALPFAELDKQWRESLASDPVGTSAKPGTP